ncbi:MAG: cob(I)yrinic acid a,c-diamide adenosyltransferase [Candidatus Cryosericum sp.]|nr:cob(I)yrinic acid a,c-diamide adenosyltransferase [bacterium]
MKPNIGAGDKGQTSLLYGGRVSKNSPRPEAYGTIDELNSTLGLAKALCVRQYSREILDRIQKDLGIVAAELATEPMYHDRLAEHGWIVTAEMVKKLEQCIVDIESKVSMPNVFIIPGATVGAAAIDLARAVVRRAERRVIGLMESGELPNENVAAYLNRTSDVLFALARYEEAGEEHNA